MKLLVLKLLSAAVAALVFHVELLDNIPRLNETTTDQ